MNDKNGSKVGRGTRVWVSFPPGVTGNEYQISGPTREWTITDWQCPNPDCRWHGDVTAFYHPTFGAWTFCGNEVAIDGDATDSGRPTPIYCRYSENGGDGNGFELPLPGDQE